jgi:thiol-disulfide isomerase/thioredoxin
MKNSIKRNLMKFSKFVTAVAVMVTTLSAQSFYVLTGVEAYDPIVANMSTQVDKKYNEELKEMIESTSKELGVKIEGHPADVLALVLTDFSVGDTKALRVELSLGEYLKRATTGQKIFAQTYMDVQQFKPEEDAEEFEEQLIDLTDEMLAKFSDQFKEDNKKISTSKNVVEHDSFASTMAYETDYNTAAAKAKKTGKPLMIFMTTNFCPWCRKLESRVLSKSDINAKVQEKFVPLMLNLDTDSFPKQFAKSRFTPILYIVDPKDESITHQFIGYNNRDGFLHLIK